MNLSRRNFLAMLGISPISVGFIGNVTDGFLSNQWQTVYKATTSLGCSTFMSHPKYELYYEQGRFVRPKIGKIFTVASPEEAFSISVKVFKCKGKVTMISPYLRNYDPDYVEKDWQDPEFMFARFKSAEIKSKCLLCDELYVEEEIFNV